LGNTEEKRALVLVLAFEVLDALLYLIVLLLEVVVGTADEGVRVLELALEIFPFLHMLDLDVHGKALGHELDVVPEAFDQHAGVALDLFQSFVHLATQLLELPVNALKALADAFKALVNAIEALVNAIEALVNAIEASVNAIEASVMRV
jgi:hypothetical protein